MDEITVRKVAIVGFADSWKEAPFTDESYEIWGLNELHKYVPRWNRWFELHDASTLGVTTRDLSEGEQKRHLDWLAKQEGKPIYMQPQFCDGRFPAAVPLPLQDLIDKFGRYFTSTIGYMVGMALLENYDVIELYGIDLASDVEYPQQRPNTEYLIGIGRGMGKTVTVCESSALLKAGHLYGYEQAPAKAGGIIDAVIVHEKSLNEQREKALVTLNTIDGALQAYNNVRKFAEYKERGATITAI